MKKSERTRNGFNFSKVKRIIADTDLDGVMPAAMIHARFPEIPITFTMTATC